MKNFKPIYLAYIAAAVVLIWAIWYFGFKKKNGSTERKMSGVCVGGSRDGEAPHWLWGCPQS